MLALADIDNDGIHDIIVAESWNGSDVVHFGDGSGGFSQTLSVPAGNWPYSVAVADLNGDGRQDLVTGNFLSSQTTIRLGACGSPTPTPTPTPTPEPTPTPQTNNITVSGSNLAVGSYNTLKEAFDAVNAGTFTGAITMTVNSDTVETAMTNITYSGNGFADYASITISPAPGGPKVISGLMADGDALINFNGADNVVIDGINSGGTSLTIANTSTTNFGVSSTVRFENGATSNIIRNSNILGSANGPNTSVILFYNDDVTPNGNDTNTIENCNIGPFDTNMPSRGVFSTGYSFDASIGNSGNIIRSNNIYDYFNPTGDSNGVFLTGGSKFWTIADNRFYQTAPRVAAFGHRHYVIWLDNPNIATGLEGISVTGNTIGFSTSAGTGTYSISNFGGSFAGVRSRVFAGGAVTNISGNTIASIDLSNSAGGVTFSGVYNEQGPSNIDSNLIGSMAANGSITLTSNTTVGTESSGIVNWGTGVNGVANNNQIGGISISNANTGSNTFHGIAGRRVSANSFSVSGNTVGGTAPDSITINGFGSTQQLIGISSNFASNISGNTVQNLTTNAGNGTAANASLIGILTGNSAVSSVISANSIWDLRNTNPSVASVVTGIQFTGSTSNVVERNHLSQLIVDSSSTSAELNGIRAAAGSTNYRNNMIAIGTDVPRAIGNSSTTGGINGINEPAGSNTFYHNSVHIGGEPTSGSGPSYAFNSSQTTVARDYRNNIFHNARSNNGSTGKNYVIRVGGTGINPAGLTINSNLYFSSGSGAVFGYFAGSDRADISLWQAAIGQDAASLFGDPMFASSLYLVNSDLHIVPSSPARDAGVDLSVANDFDGDLRPTVTGIDIGADEVLTPTAALVSVGGRVATPAGQGIGATALTMTAGNGDVRQTISNAFGYYRFDGVEAGQTYILAVRSKRFEFVSPIRFISVDSDITDADFISSP